MSPIKNIQEFSRSFFIFFNFLWVFSRSVIHFQEFPGVLATLIVKILLIHRLLSIRETVKFLCNVSCIFIHKMSCDVHFSSHSNLWDFWLEHFDLFGPCVHHQLEDISTFSHFHHFLFQGGLFSSDHHLALLRSQETNAIYYQQPKQLHTSHWSLVVKLWLSPLVIIWRTSALVGSTNTVPVKLSLSERKIVKFSSCSSFDILFNLKKSGQAKVSGL